MRWSRRPFHLVIAGILMAAGLTASCRSAPDAAYWRDRRDRPRPLPPLTLTPAWDRPLPFVPSAIEMDPAGGIVVKAEGHAVRLSTADGTEWPPVETAAPAERMGPAGLPPPAPPEPAPEGSADGPGGTAWAGLTFSARPAEGVLVATDARSGRARWSVRAAAAVVAGPQVYRGQVLLQSLDNYVYCLRARNGHEVWRARTSGRLTRPAVFFRDRVLVIPDGAAAVTALDLYDGSPAGTWALNAERGRFVAGPALAGDLLIAAHAGEGSRAGSVLALRLAERSGPAPR